MASSFSPSRQKNAVSEGIALGLLMCGTSELPNDKVAIDLSLVHAWRNWSYRTRFPSAAIGAKTASEPVYAMTHADERHHTLNFYWSSEGVAHRIHERPSWQWQDVDYDEAAATIDGDVPASGWQELAATFLERLKLP